MRNIETMAHEHAVMGNTKDNYGIFRVCSLRNLSRAVESISVNRYGSSGL